MPGVRRFCLLVVCCWLLYVGYLLSVGRLVRLFAGLFVCSFGVLLCRVFVFSVCLCVCLFPCLYACFLVWCLVVVLSVCCLLSLAVGRLVLVGCALFLVGCGLLLMIVGWVFCVFRCLFVCLLLLDCLLVSVVVCVVGWRAVACVFVCGCFVFVVVVSWWLLFAVVVCWLLLSSLFVFWPAFVVAAR